MNVSRRKIFTSFLKPFATQFAAVTAEPAPLAAAWLPIGSLGEFPLGSVTPVNDGRHMILSDEDGLWAVDAETESARHSARRPLNIDNKGTLSLDPNGIWPRGAVLNIMTGTQSIVSEETSP